MAQVVVNASVLGIAKQDGHKLQVHAVHLLCYFRERHILVVDANGELVKQYRRCVGKVMGNNYPPPVVHQLLYTHLWNNKRIVYVSAKLSSKQKRLLKSVNYPHKDYILVAIALRTKDRLIVTEDEGLHTPDIVEMLKNEFRTRIFHIQAALHLLGAEIHRTVLDSKAFL